MKIAYFDTVGGIAGDMTMAACVSAGLPIDVLSEELRKLGIGGFEIVGSHVRRNAVDAVHIDVLVSNEPHIHRDMQGISSLIDRSSLSPRIKERAKSIFSVIAAAEARVHNTTVEKVHFHEVGALDSIVDIVGTSICLEYLGIERVYSSPVRLGSGGMIRTQHGLLPSPAPATIEILKGYPVVLTDIPEELTTPTGAGIIKALSFGTMSTDILLPEAIGYGAGTREFADIPNFLRVIVGELQADVDRDEVAIVETNIDDMNPQVYPVLIEQLLAAGALDAYLIPVIMKKGRPGILLSVLVGQAGLDAITEIIYRLTTTIGLRILNAGRRKLPRRLLEVQTSFGRVKAKAVIRNGVELITPEFEECRRIASEKGIPLPEVMKILEREITGMK